MWREQNVERTKFPRLLETNIDNCLCAELPARIALETIPGSITHSHGCMLGSRLHFYPLWTAKHPCRSRLGHGSDPDCRPENVPFQGR